MEQEPSGPDEPTADRVLNWLALTLMGASALFLLVFFSGEWLWIDGAIVAAVSGLTFVAVKVL